MAKDMLEQIFFAKFPVLENREQVSAIREGINIGPARPERASYHIPAKPGGRFRAWGYNRLLEAG